MDASIYYRNKWFGERDLNKTRGGLDASICYSHKFIGEKDKRKQGGAVPQRRRREQIPRKRRAARNASLLLSVLMDFAPVLASRVGEQIPAQST